VPEAAACLQVSECEPLECGGMAGEQHDEKVMIFIGHAGHGARINFHELQFGQVSDELKHEEGISPVERLPGQDETVNRARGRQGLEQ
jgi:hypothetical protein